MPKSKIIKELANSTIDTATTLKRLKILLFEFDKPELNEWVNSELNGYKNTNSLPDYRVFQGQVYASFLVGYMQYTNIALPLMELSDDERNYIRRCPFVQGISAICSFAENESLKIVIPPELYPTLTGGTNIDSIIEAHVSVPPTAPQEIITAIETKILEILCLLEKEFGILDDLDLDFSSKSSKEIEAVSTKIINIINVDKSISIGDSNKIAKADIKTQ